MNAWQTLMDVLWSAGAVSVTARCVTLAGGRQSHVAVSLRHFVCQPANLNRLADVFGPWLADGRPALCPVSSLLSPILSGALAARFGLPLILTRPLDADKGLAGQVCGRVGKGPIVLVDDILAADDTVLATADLLTRHGAKDMSLFVFVDKRPLAAREAFPLSVTAPIKLDELLHYGIGTARLTGEAVDWAEEELRFLEGEAGTAQPVS